MNNSRALRLLGVLASIELQKRYILNGTKDAYIVLEEVLEDAHQFIRKSDTGTSTPIANLKERLDQFELDDDQSNEDILLHNEDFASLRSSAYSVLNSLGADLAKYEQSFNDA